MKTDINIQHSPLPWRVEDDNSIYCTRPDEGPWYSHVAEVESVSGDMPDCINAQFIVTACNAHYDLVAALEACVEELEILADMYPKGRHRADSLTAARAALAKAKGEQP